MRAGRLKHRLRLQESSESRDSFGEPDQSWSTTATVWGGVEALRGDEQFAANQVSSELQIKIIIRYGSEWSGINTKWRILDANTAIIYDIKSVILPEHRSRPNTVIELVCVVHSFGSS